MIFAPFALFLAAAPARAAELKHRFYVAPDEIRELDSRALAELLVARIRRGCDLAGAPPSGGSVLGGDAEMILMVPARLLDLIARDGFLNRHQTETTGGFDRERDRFETEQELAMLRLPFGEKGRELLPKYAVLDVKKAGLGTFRLPTQYGSVAVVFKKEIAARATWTYADSLDYSRKSGRFDAGGDDNPVLTRTFLYERKGGDRGRCGNYCEAQIWGKLGLGDVAYAMVSASEPVPGALIRAGVPVYDYSVPDSTVAVVDAGRTAQYVRGALRSAAPSASADSPPSPLAAAREESAAFSPRQRLVGELAERAKSPGVFISLEKEFASGDDQTRALALYGLSELPWSAFKPRLLEALRAPKGPLLIEAVAFAAERRDDADVAARLAALRRGAKTDAAEWLERLDKARLCVP
jgi:hypothetical protein